MTQARKRRNPRRWSARVTRTSNALDLDRGVFDRAKGELRAAFHRPKA